MKRSIFILFAIMFLVLSMYSIDRVNVFASGINDDINAKTYIVIDSNKKILDSKDCDKKREVASICKLMTTLLTVEKIDRGEIDLNDKMLVSQFAADAEGSQAFLDAGKEYTVEELLKSVIIASANDSAIVLAENIGGSERAFVSSMNSRARELGMNSTIYANSTGLPAPEQYSTAYDTALLLMELDKYDIYHKYSTVWIDHITHSSGRKTELVNTNRNIRYYEYCDMGKTGFTDEAGYCLATKNTKGELSIYTVVLGCSNSAARFTDSMKLSNFVFANYISSEVVSTGEILPTTVKVSRGKKDSLELLAKDSLRLTRKVGDTSAYDIRYELPTEIEAKITEGDVVGKILVIEDSVVVSEIDIVAAETIERETYGDIIGRVIDNFPLVG